jgi:hypothetical protein
MLFSEALLTGTGQILHKCVRKIWEVRRVTSSLVAWAGVVVSLPPAWCTLHSHQFFSQAKYIPSADTELRETGQKTKIEYSKDFRRFKAFIMTKSDEKWMQETLTFIHKHVFVGINSPITDADTEQRGHDYDDEYAAMMEEFDRINISDNNENGNLLQPSFAPPHPNLSQSLQSVTGHQNAVARPSIPPARRETPAAVTAELDAAGALNETAGPSRPAVRMRVPSTVLLETAVDMAGKEGSTGPVVRQTRGNSRKAKGKAKA